MQTENTSPDAVRVEQCENPEEWDAFVSEHVGPPTALWGWGEVIEAYDHDRLYLVARLDDEIVGAVPLIHMQSLLFGDKLVSMPYTARGSIVLGDDGPEAAKRALLERTRELADKFGVDFVSLRGRALEEAPGFTRKRRFVTFEIPLADDPDENWQRLDSSRRGHVRTARETDLEIRQADSDRDLRRYYELHLDNMRKFGTPPHSFAFFERLWHEFGDVVQIDLAELGDRLVNAQIVFRFGDRCIHWGAVSDHDYRDLQGGSLLLWDSIERACRDGYETYSLGRTREGTGVYMYKKSWGGRKVWFDDYHYFPDGECDLPDPEDDRYKRAKDVWRRLPIPVTRAVGPTLRKEISL